MKEPWSVGDEWSNIEMHLGLAFLGFNLLVVDWIIIFPFSLPKIMIIWSNIEMQIDLAFLGFNLLDVD